ncbi:hypothetical protein [Fischerella thermalis]|uniref:hypothetical protein n=1 Tax=Fischerella thermalis TaxID=372787 RepID=UPI00307DEF34
MEILRNKAGGRGLEAEGWRQRAGGRGQRAEGWRQRAEGRGQRAEVIRYWALETANYQQTTTNKQQD